MKNDGKSLESLVAFIEQLQLPPKFTVATNTKIFNEEGIQTAEFDVEIKGKLGTTSISWLIECRDRPGDGPAPGSWIEQLVGRRSRFGFNKVTAVSTTGFASGAVDFAKQQGVELREVRELSPKTFSSWLVVGSFPVRRPRGNLVGTIVIVSKDEPSEVQTALGVFLRNRNASEKIFRSTETGECVSGYQIFQTLLRTEADGLVQSINPGDGVKKARLTYQFPSDTSHYVVEMGQQVVRVREITFDCELSVVEELVPISKSAQYADVVSGEAISQMVSYEFAAFDKKVALEMHNVAETGETHVVLRFLPF